MHGFPLCKHIRTIDSGSAGGSAPTESEKDPVESGEPTDWEAKYNEAMKHSRDWEKRAKDNKAAADELEQLKASQMTDAQKAEAHIKELEGKVTAYEAEKRQAQWRAQVAKETNVPADLIRGGSLEEMQDFAKRLDGYLHPKPKGAAVHNQNGTPNHGADPERAEKLNYINQMFGTK
ncbi:putative phage helicase [Bifidobacterium actinocoloniiforme DSM 22766]|uniref:Putative phage helicase n=1 Tax=Bifidobacterium actinocoloniiforme DSM 22766 TaxID=1437605 RepID=A0A086YZU7_9BIFI|nr:hypothetical protein [Bifidobacterium actinocoloniiforme]AKV55084.1 hypothetical protein AB656_01105 [Bifidobacterium actinocoloniiforme DSM 22766]KFI39797.1 putative phage helicase [Bifidobacterium actinocoloniiforme DSM 22766]